MGYAEIELPNGQTRRIGGEEEPANELDPLTPGQAEYQRQLARLVISGGKPYILIVVDPETTQASVTWQGFTDPAAIAQGLAEIARDMAAGAAA
jgi:hypothetical protein